MASKVFFTNFRTTKHENLPQKLARLVKKAGMLDGIDFDILTRRHDLYLEHGRYGEPILSPGKTVMEVKFRGAVPLWFCRVMSDLGLSFHTFSKCGTDFKLYTYEKALATSDEERYLRLIH